MPDKEEKKKEVPWEMTDHGKPKREQNLKNPTAESKTAVGF